jgi:arginyl-tRNA synthetase
MNETNIVAAVLQKVCAANAALIADGVLPTDIDQSRIAVEPPREAAHGDLATNAAMVMAKHARKNARDLAERIVAKLGRDDLFAKLEVAGPGFINVTLKPAAWIGTLRRVLQAADYGRSDMGQGAAVNVEYVCANPTGPMHVDHCRGAVFGDALANLLAFTGFRVTRECYVNDAGAQVDALARSAFLRYREALGEKIGRIPERLYPGDYLEPVGAALAAEYGPDLLAWTDHRWLPIVRQKAVDMMMSAIRDDLAALNVRPDVFFSERALSADGTDVVARTISELRQRGLVYQGRLAPPKGAAVEDQEDREQTLFRSTEFGDNVDRPLIRSDGGYTYFASDIAYHRNKLDRGFGILVDVRAPDHAGYVKHMRAAVSAVSAGNAELDVKIVQPVKLLRGGEPLNMSKRAGEFVTLREVVDEVGRDAVRFMMLYRNNDAVLDFDLLKVIEQSRDNPVFYVQYAHARAQSVFRNAREVLRELPGNDSGRTAPLANAPLDRLQDAGELALMRRIALYPRLIEATAGTHEPHRVAYYLYELASEFHAHWNRGRDTSHLRFIIENDPQLTMARLALVQGVVTVLASGLCLLGVEAPQEMR